ncbi:MAG: hydroxymethylglutaryl-CoA lyase [Janthinobacterium lividum]
MVDRVEIVEVGPRDGLQNIPIFVPTETKIALIRALAAAGFRRMELGSFVGPKAVPQMSDMEAVAAAVGIPHGVRAMVLVPNARGFQRAITAGYNEIELVISVSDAHNRANVGRPTQDSVEDLRRLLAEMDPDGKLFIRIGLATSFHCPFAGLTDEADVLALLGQLVAIRPGMEYAIADTTGMAIPAHVRSLCGRVLQEFGDRGSFLFHGHDTAGFGIANILAAMESGIRTFDTAIGGLGGCPFAPGASGNIATEDAVYLFDRMGVATGIDMGKLMAAGDIATGLPGAVVASHARAMPRDRTVGKRLAAAA